MTSVPRPRVLIADPDTAIHGLITAILRRDGIVSEGVFDRESALRRIRDQRYAAVIVDPHMPDGDALLSELFAAAPDGQPNIIVVTTPDASTYLYQHRAGVRGVLPKPFGVADLSSLVRQCCAGSHAAVLDNFTPPSDPGTTLGSEP